MSRIKCNRLIFALLLFSGIAFGQGVRYDVPPILNSRAVLVPNANISLCPGTATITNSTCSPASTQAFTDITLTTPCATGSPVVLPQTNVCSGVADALGNAGFWLSPGAYIYCINGPTITGKCYNLTVPMGSTAVGGATIPLVKSFQGVQYANGFPGADVCAQVANAITALPSGGGTVFLQLAGATQTCTSGNLTIPTAVRLMIDGGTLSTNAGIIIGANAATGASIYGAGKEITSIVCTGSNAKCVDIAQGVGARNRNVTIKDLTINANGTTQNALTIEDGLSNTTIENIQLRATGRCVNGITGVNGGLFTNMKQVRCDQPGDPTFAMNLDFSGGTIQTTFHLDNVYANGNGSTPLVGIATGNGDFTFSNGAVDHIPTCYQLGGNTVALNIDAEACTTAGFAILESGTFDLSAPTCTTDAVCINVNASNANTVIKNPVTTGTTGSFDITYQSGNSNLLIGGLLMQKPVSVTSPVSVMQCVSGKCTILNGTTAQKAETGADATLLSYTPAAAAGTYRVCISMAVSAQNTATLGWTATWTDSNGSAQAPTNLALNQTGVAAPALTFTAATNGNYFACQNFDVNNAGTAIVVKTTFTGTSIAYKASAGVERLQ